MLPMVSRQRYELDRLRTALQSFVVVVLDLQGKRTPCDGIALHHIDLLERHPNRLGPDTADVAAKDWGLWGAARRIEHRQAKQDWSHGSCLLPSVRRSPV